MVTCFQGNGWASLPMGFVLVICVSFLGQIISQLQKVITICRPLQSRRQLYLSPLSQNFPSCLRSFKIQRPPFRLWRRLLMLKVSREGERDRPRCRDFQDGDVVCGCRCRCVMSRYLRLKWRWKKKERKGIASFICFLRHQRINDSPLGEISFWIFVVVWTSGSW